MSNVELPACHGVAAAKPAHCANPDTATITAHPINAPSSRRATSVSGGGRRRELDHTDILLDGNVRPVELTAMADGWAIASRRNATVNSTKPSAWPYSQ